jgi:hypothetical protein
MIFDRQPVNLQIGDIDGVPITMAEAAARSCTLKTSPIHADTIVMTAEPPIPASTLMMIRLGIFGANEHPMRKTLKNAVDQLMTTGRP